MLVIGHANGELLQRARLRLADGGDGDHSGTSSDCFRQCGASMTRALDQTLAGCWFWRVMETQRRRLLMSCQAVSLSFENHVHRETRWPRTPMAGARCGARRFLESWKRKLADVVATRCRSLLNSQHLCIVTQTYASPRSALPSPRTHSSTPPVAGLQEAANTARCALASALASCWIALRQRAPTMVP
jgi:hypothetical protein